MSSYDLAIAAAAAGLGGQDVVMEPAPRQYQRLPLDISINELPSVDDLEVAAAAAAAALEVLGPAQDSSEVDTSDSDEDSDDDSEDSEDEEEEQEEESDEEMAEADGKATAAGGGVQVRLQLLPSDGTDPSAPLQLRITTTTTTAAAAAAAATQDGGPGRPELGATSSSESSSSEDSVSEAEGEPLDYEGMRELISKAYEQDEEAEALQHHSVQAEMGLADVAPLDMEVGADEPIELAGKVTALLEGMVVVQCPEHARALEEGSLLCLQDRTLIGRVEEVFGLVQSPMYALRYAGKQPAPAELAPGAVLYGVVAHCTYFDPHALPRAPAVDVDEVEAADGAGDEERYFSDDEAEAEWQRSRAQQGHKRKGQAPGSEGGRARQRHGGGPGGGRGCGQRQQQQQQQVYAGNQQYQQQPRPLPGFQAMATAGQLSGMGLQGSGRAVRHPPAAAVAAAPIAQPNLHQQYMQPQQHQQQPGYGSHQGRIMGPNGPLTPAAPPPQALNRMGAIMGPEGGYMRPAAPAASAQAAAGMVQQPGYAGAPYSQQQQQQQQLYGAPPMPMHVQERPPGGIMFARPQGPPRPQQPQAFGPGYAGYGPGLWQAPPGGHLQQQPQQQQQHFGQPYPPQQQPYARQPGYHPPPGY